MQKKLFPEGGWSKYRPRGAARQRFPREGESFSLVASFFGGEYFRGGRHISSFMCPLHFEERGDSRPGDGWDHAIETNVTIANLT